MYIHNISIVLDLRFYFSDVLPCEQRFLSGMSGMALNFCKVVRVAYQSRSWFVLLLENANARKKPLLVGTNDHDNFSPGKEEMENAVISVFSNTD